MKGHFFLISLLPIPENLGLKKLCCHDSFAVNVKGLHIVCTPSSFCLSTGGWGLEGLNLEPKFQKGGDLAVPQLLEEVTGG